MTNFGRAMILLAATGGVLALAAAPAIADVKAGVDAWSRGDYRKAVDEWRPAAVAGDPDAQFNLGQAYKLGRGVPVDLVLAEEWYRKAALQGHVQASDNYALALFQNGKHDEAVPWLEKSVARGEPRAQLVLGTMLFNGDSVERDWVRAYALIVRASASGLPQGSQTLAQMDQYIPADTRQKGIALARQYEASEGSFQTQTELAGQGSAGSIRGAELPASIAADDGSSDRLAPPPAREARVKPTPKPRPAPVELAPVETHPAVAAAPVRPAVGKGVRLQLGAFRDEGNAHGLWQQVQRAPAVAALQPYFVKIGALTALQIGPVAPGDVGRVCGEVKARAAGTPCVTVGR